MYLSLYCKGSKRLFKVLWWEGVGDRTGLQYIDPHSYGRQRCVFLVLLMLNWRPRGPALCWMMAFFTASYHQLVWSPNSIGIPEGPKARCGFPYHISSITRLISNSSGAPRPPRRAFSTTSYSNFSGPQIIRTPRAPSAWCGFPYHISSLTPTVWLFVLTELYNSSTPTQSPTQSLEWHVWLSSSGNKCHAVHRSFSSGASVYKCTMGIFTLSHFISQARLRDFIS